MLLILLTSLILLGFILLVIYRNEYRLKKISAPDGKVKEYWGSRERRQSVRLEIPLEIKYTCAPAYNHNHHSLTRNISQGGVQLLIYEKLNVGDIINLELNLTPQEHPIIGKGEIVWLKDAAAEGSGEQKRAFVTGIKFIGLKLRDEERLSAFIYNKCQVTTSSPPAGGQVWE